MRSWLARNWRYWRWLFRDCQEALKEVARLRRDMRELLHGLRSFELHIERRLDRLELRLKLLEMERAGRAAEAIRAAEFQRARATTAPWNLNEGDIRRLDESIADEEKTWPRRRPG